MKDKMAEVCGRPNIKPVLGLLKEKGHLKHNNDRTDWMWRGTAVYGVHFTLFADGAKVVAEPA